VEKAVPVLWNSHLNTFFFTVGCARTPRRKKKIKSVAFQSEELMWLAKILSNAFSDVHCSKHPIWSKSSYIGNWRWGGW